jgi:uncharacterized protein YegJ (DUF2314 family)
MSTATQNRSDFKPNRLTFDQGVERVQEALKKHRMSMSERIITSRDPGVDELCRTLKVDNVPSGFNKWQLPIILDRSQLYISVAQPNATVPLHSHDEGDGVRLMLSGSIIYEGKELSAGDWMFIPKGKPYAFTVGRFGAVMGYCYQCCCA